MEFNYIDPNIPNGKVMWAKSNLNALFIELGIHCDNKYVGTGLGGNNFLLLALMDMKHRLGYFDKRLQYDPNHNEMLWDVRWFGKFSFKCVYQAPIEPMKKVRKRLDYVFSKIDERFKYKAMFFHSVCPEPRADYVTQNLREVFISNEKNFPTLSACMRSGFYFFDPRLSKMEQLILAYVMCQDLSTQLDKGDLTKLQTIGHVMRNFEPEIFLLAVRKWIMIERLVHHSMDEDPVWGPQFSKINNMVF